TLQVNATTTRAVYTTNTLAQGMHTITATYNSSSSFAASTSPTPVTVTVSANGPSVTTQSVNTGIENTTVTLTGTGFAGTSSVTFNGAPAFFTVSGDTSITTRVPMNATSGNI